jgi:hypothetical protein
MSRASYRALGPEQKIRILAVHAGAVLVFLELLGFVR